MMSENDRYERLAEYARQQGWPQATGSTVRGWCRSRLLPPARVEHPAFGVRRSVEDAEAYRQLLEACRLRWDRKLRRHEQLAIHLWLAGFAIDRAVVRAALRWTSDQLPRYLRRYRGVDVANATPQATEAALEELALTVAGSGTGDAEDMRYRGLFEFMKRILGARVSEPDAEALANVEWMLGLERARTDAVGEAGPWLDNAPRGEAIRQGAEHVNLASLRAAIDDATDVELDTARGVVGRFTTVWTVLGEVLRLFPDGFAGLGLFSEVISGSDGPALMTVMALILADESATFVEDLESQNDINELRDQLAVLAANPELVPELRLELASLVHVVDPATAGASGGDQRDGRLG